MSMPTPEEIASWPIPDYENPHGTLEFAIYGINISLMAAMTMFIAGRFYSRILLTRSALGADDWTMLAAYIMAIAMSICQVIETDFGVGRHFFDVNPAWYVPLGQTTVSIQALFAPCAALTKISTCLTYLRLFPSRTNKWFNYVQIGILAGFGVSTTVGMLVQCIPMSDVWNFIKPPSEKQCIDQEAFFIAAAVQNSGTDFLVYLWPIYYLWRIKLSLVKRIGLIISFGVGVLICIAGIVRITWQVRYANSWDQTYNGAIIFIIVAIELNLGIVCGCLPGIRPLIRKFFPALKDSTRPSNQEYSTSIKATSESWKPRKGEASMNSIRVTNEVELSVWDIRTDGQRAKRDGRLGEGDSEELIYPK